MVEVGRQVLGSSQFPGQSPIPAKPQNHSLPCHKKVMPTRMQPFRVPPLSQAHKIPNNLTKRTLFFIKETENNKDHPLFLASYSHEFCGRVVTVHHPTTTSGSSPSCSRWRAELPTSLQAKHPSNLVNCGLAALECLSIKIFQNVCYITISYNIYVDIV